MKFILTKASNSALERPIEINTIQELMALIEEYDESIIIIPTNQTIFKYPEIRIYDDYVE